MFLLAPEDVKRAMSIDAEQQISARVTRRFRASPERVFDAWLDPKTARKWLFAKAAGQIVCAEIDGRVGGWFYIVNRCDGEDVEHVGEYFEVNRPHRLGFKLLVEKHAQNFDRVTVDRSARARLRVDLDQRHSTELRGRCEAHRGMLERRPRPAR